MPLLTKKLFGLVLPAVFVLASGCYSATPPTAQSSGISAPLTAKADERKPVEPGDANPPASVADPPNDPTEKATTEKPAAAVPLDLKPHYALKAAAFDKITQYPWPAVPRGSQTFANVPLEIGGAIFLWGERNAKNGLKYPEEITGIATNQKFETLYVCHGAFYEAKAGTKMCEVKFHYEDNTSASDTIVCGEDARDWFVKPTEKTEKMLGPSGPRSTLAWSGDGKIGDRTQTIRFCLTAIDNPHPDKVVTAIDLISSKTQTAACILAITTGKAGLLKPK